MWIMLMTIGAGVAFIGSMITKAVREDLERIMDLQKIAFRSEAERYNDFEIPPLTQTLEDIQADFQEHLFLKFVEDGDIVGAVKGRQDDQGVCFIGRLVVLPEFQKRGIGRRLMLGMEAAFPDCEKFEIFTGERSEGNIRLYRNLGYEITGRRDTGFFDLVVMQKLNGA